MCLDDPVGQCSIIRRWKPHQTTQTPQREPGVHFEGASGKTKERCNRRCHYSKTNRVKVSLEPKRTIMTQLQCKKKLCVRWDQDKAVCLSKIQSDTCSVNLTQRAPTKTNLQWNTETGTFINRHDTTSGQNRIHINTAWNKSTWILDWLKHGPVIFHLNETTVTHVSWTAWRNKPKWHWT